MTMVCAIQGGGFLNIATLTSHHHNSIYFVNKKYFVYDLFFMTKTRLKLNKKYPLKNYLLFELTLYVQGVNYVFLLFVDKL